MPDELNLEDEITECYFISNNIPLSEIKEYFNAKKEYLVKHASKVADIWLSGVGTVAFLASSTSVSDFSIKSLCIGGSVVCLAAASYNLSKNKKLSDHFNELNEEHGLTFVKKR